jgi:fibronectin type 3 domain-containing protein
VYRAAPGEDLARIGTTTGATTAFVDREVRPGATYRYAVTAIDRALAPNESLRSEVVTVTVPP